MIELIDIGDHCTHCGRDTSPGTGLFVNRIPSDTETERGYLCPDCAAFDCDRCGEKIEVDHDITPEDVYPDGDKRQHLDFPALPAEGKGSGWRVHFECLTKEEKAFFEATSDNYFEGG